MEWLLEQRKTLVKEKAKLSHQITVAEGSQRETLKDKRCVVVLSLVVIDGEVSRRGLWGKSIEVTE